MIKLSNKERYAIQALSDLAFHGVDAPAQIREIADRQRIPLRFLEQIFQDLKRAGLVGATRGPRGGYRLARAPQEICVGDVVRATSGPVVGFGARRARAGVARDLRAVTDAVLGDLAVTVERCFDAVTLEDVCVRGERLGLARRSGPARYAI